MDSHGSCQSRDVPLTSIPVRSIEEITKDLTELPDQSSSIMFRKTLASNGGHPELMINY